MKNFLKNLKLLLCMAAVMSTVAIGSAYAQADDLIRNDVEQLRKIFSSQRNDTYQAGGHLELAMVQEFALATFRHEFSWVEESSSPDFSSQQAGTLAIGYAFSMLNDAAALVKCDERRDPGCTQIKQQIHDLGMDLITNMAYFGFIGGLKDSSGQEQPYLLVMDVSEQWIYGLALPNPASR